MTETEVERDLRELFRAQAAGLHPSRVEWGVPAIDAPAARGRRGRSIAVAAVGIAAVAAVILALGLRSPHHTSVTVPAASPSAAPANPVVWETPQVRIQADDFRIDIDGTTFTGVDPNIDVHSDPGNDRYQTFELVWHEHGVEMRWNIYFTSDGTNWWANEMRTYNGKNAYDGTSSAYADWVTFQGEFFRSPLGQPFVGDLNATAYKDGVTSHLIAKGLRINAFRA